MKRSGVIALLLLVTAASFWYLRIHGPGAEDRPITRSTDRFAYFYPTAVFIHDEVRASRLPLWNAYEYAGTPFVAMPAAGALYPFNLLFFGLFEPALGLEIHAIFHLVVAGLATWLFASALGLGAPACAVAALAYMLSGSMLSGVLMTPYFSTQAWIPAMAWTLLGIVRAPRLRWALGFAVATALAFLGGFHQVFLGAVYLLGAFGLFAWVAFAQPGQRLRVAGFAATGAVLALGLVAPQLAPILELARDATRGLDGLTLRQAYHPYVLPEILRSGLVGGLLDVRRVDFHAIPMARYAFPFLFLPLAACGAFAKGQVKAWIFFALAFVLLFDLLGGPHGFVFGLFFQLPGVALFRGPIRFVGLYGFAGAMLLAFGVQAILGRVRAEWHHARWALATLAIVGIGADFAIRSRLDLRTPMISPPQDRLTKALGEDWGHDRVFIERASHADPQWLSKQGLLARVATVPGYEPSLPGLYAAYFGIPRDSLWHGQLALGGRAHRVKFHADDRMLDLMSVAAIAVDKRSPRRNRGAGGRSHPNRRVVIRARRALPRAYAVSEVEVVRNLEAALAAIRAPDFDPFARAVVTWDGSGSPTDLAMENEAARQRPSQRAGSMVDIDEMGPQTVKLSTHCAQNCLVVLTDLDYPGWSAEIDGNPARVLRTNAIYRGVWVTAGRHELVYRYRPRSLAVGAWIAFGTVVVAMVLAILDSRGRLCDQAKRSA